MKCFNLQDEMMSMDLVNCTCNYFLNYHCRVISADRVHTMGRIFPFTLRGRAIEGLPCLLSGITEISAIPPVQHFMSLHSLQLLHVTTKRNGEFGKEKQLNWLFSAMWTKTSFSWPQLSLFYLWFFSFIHIP